MMYQKFRIANNAVTLDQPIQFGAGADGHNFQVMPVAMDHKWLACLRHLIKQAINIPPQLGRCNRHNKILLIATK